MSTNEVPVQLTQLAEKMRDSYTKSEYEIAHALAEAEGPMTIDDLVEVTGYTERTIKKRVGTLEETLGGDPLLRRDDDGRPVLHGALAAAIRHVNEVE